MKHCWKREDPLAADHHDDRDDDLWHAAARACPGRRLEMRQGMAVVVVGGLISSTLLTLVLIPVIYTYVDGLRVTLPGLFRRVTWAAWLPWKGRPEAVPGSMGEALGK